MAMNSEIHVLEVLETVGYHFEGSFYAQHHYTFRLRHHLFYPDLLYEKNKNEKELTESRI